MVFADPAYLWGLLGILIPIGIHLWSKKEGRTILIGSVQLLKDSNPKKSSQLKLNELLLLLIRVLITGLIVLIIAGAGISRDRESKKLIYLVEPSLLKEQLIDTDSIPDDELRLLTKGLPMINEWEPGDLMETPDYWQLVAEMNKLPADSIVVFTKGLTEGVKGKRPAGRAYINWITINPCIPVKKMVKAFYNGKNIIGIQQLSDCNSTTFEKKVYALESEEIMMNPERDSILIRDGKDQYRLPLDTLQSLKILLKAEDKYNSDRIYLVSAVKAIGSYLDIPVQIETFENGISADDDLTIWLSDDPLPKNYRPLLYFNEDDLAPGIICRGDEDFSFILTAHLNSENIFSRHLTEALVDILDPYRISSELISTNDQRMTNSRELSVGKAGGEKTITQKASTDISNWLWIIVILLLITERIIADHRKQ